MSNTEEFAENTDPNNPDSDGDGLNDGQEVALGRNPVLRDYAFGSDSAIITNQFIPIAVGEKRVYSGTGSYAGYGRYIKVIGVEVADEVNCLKVMVKGHGNQADPDLDPEWYYLWLAQDTSGVVWLLKVYEAQGDLTTTFGKDNAVVWMPAEPAGWAGV